MFYQSCNERGGDVKHRFKVGVGGWAQSFKGSERRSTILAPRHLHH